MWTKNILNLNLEIIDLADCGEADFLVEIEGRSVLFGNV